MIPTSITTQRQLTITTVRTCGYTLIWRKVCHPFHMLSHILLVTTGAIQDHHRFNRDDPPTRTRRHRNMEPVIRARSQRF